MKAMPLPHLLKALRHHVSDKAWAAIIAHLMACRTKSPAVDKEVYTFTQVMIETMGGPAVVDTICETMGL